MTKVEQAIKVAKVVWNELTSEQKNEVYQNGTLPFVDHVFGVLGYDVDLDIKPNEYNEVVEVVYVLEESR